MYTILFWNIPDCYKEYRQVKYKRVRDEVCLKDARAHVLYHIVLYLLLLSYVCFLMQ